MGENWLQQKRRERINTIRNSIRAATKENVGVDKEKLIAACCIDWGMRDNMIREVVEQLISADFIEMREDGLLWTKGEI